VSTRPSLRVDCHEIWESELPGTRRACPDLCRLLYLYCCLQDVFVSVTSAEVDPELKWIPCD